MLHAALQSAIAAVPPGRWGIGVSGGADSVALLRLLASRSELCLHVIHLDHQTRGQASDDDADFVRQLAARLNLPMVIELRETVEREAGPVPANVSARYRAARFSLFSTVAARENLQGVFLAHHADDQAETILHRLIRGSGPAGLAGMSMESRIGALTVLRPLLAVRRAELRDYLKEIGQDWREDASNASAIYLRNRLRRWLCHADPDLHEALISLGDACRGLRQWASRAAPELGNSFKANQLGDLPNVLAQESARRWLLARGAPPGELTEAVLERLIEMSRDAATPPGADFPGSIHVRRRGGAISIG